jgi:DNA-binding NtrC family response regulator
VLPLAAEFAARAARAAGRAAPVIDPAVQTRLTRHAWPGNVRELRNVIERAVVLCGDGPITLAHFPDAPAFGTAPARPVREAAAPSRTGALAREIEAHERQQIIDALEKCGGNQTRAAAMLGISRRTLVGRLGHYDLPRPRKGPREPT